MTSRSYAVGLLFVASLFLALTSLGWGQGSLTCPGGLSPMNHWCGSYTAVDQNCRSGPQATTGSCTGLTGGYNIGWYSYNQKNTTYQNSITASYIDDWPSQPARNEVVPSLAAGSFQYMEVTDRYLQAFDKTTGDPIFVNNTSLVPPNPLFYPQPENGAWSSNQSCGGENNDWNISYDHVNGVWVLVGMAKVMGNHNNITNGILCIAVSTSDQLLLPNTSNPNCFFPNGYCNFWSTYGFDITSLLPSFTDSNNVVYYDLPDYARFGTWVGDGNYYVTFDLLDGENNANNGIIHGFAACQISGSTLRAGNEYNGGTTSPVTC